jgi:cytochrome c5
MINVCRSFCWHCDGHTRFHTRRNGLWGLFGAKVYQIECCSCHTSGPLSSGEVMAADAWNDMCKRLKRERGPF